jgi:hypothetical protein
MSEQTSFLLEIYKDSEGIEWYEDSVLELNNIICGKRINVYQLVKFVIKESLKGIEQGHISEEGGINATRKQSN